jgi:hypothetical protein
MSSKLPRDRWPDGGLSGAPDEREPGYRRNPCGTTSSSVVVADELAERLIDEDAVRAGARILEPLLATAGDGAKVLFHEAIHIIVGLAVVMAAF